MTKISKPPVKVELAEGLVTVDSPPDMIGTLTPEAARELAEQLRQAADEAADGSGD